MRKIVRWSFTLAALMFILSPAVKSQRTKVSRSVSRPAAVYDVRAFGARGDGKSVDTRAINSAIEAANAAGGGTVLFTAGTYLCFSIRLKSNVTLYLDNGATILAADPKETEGSYDLPEPNEWDKYQDFGHSHWHNSLIWGENLENVSILGPGLITGKGLTRRSPRPRRPVQSGDRPTTLGGGQAGAPPQSPLGEDDPPEVMYGLGNKAVALKLCRNVTLRDFSVLNGGHFALLATGVDNLTIDNVKVDTNRDGLDIDSCRNVRIANCSVNSPNDDAIVLKSSYALGVARATENVTITNCLVSGYDIGSLLDATYKKNVTEAPDKDGPTGRIKLGTESNGGFKNITISNIVFDHGGGKKELVDVHLPERETNYPEPSMFGATPAYGFFIRHVEGIEFNNVTVNYLNAEMRPPFLLEEVTFAKFNNVTGYRALVVPMFVLRNVSDFNTRGCISF